MASSLDGFAAFTEGQARVIQSMGRVTPEQFSIQSLIFADTPEGAVENVLQSTNNPPEAAHTTTDWLVLGVSLSAEQVVNAFKTNRLVRCGEASPGQSTGWYFYGELAFCGEEAVPFEWSQLQVAPLGVVQWAEKCLTGRYRPVTDGPCSGCGAAGVSTWASPDVSQHYRLAYCASCWNGFFECNLENRAFQKAKWADEELKADLDSTADTETCCDTDM